MSFISLQFLLFLTGSVMLYYILPKKIRWVVLLITNIIFYVSNSGSLTIYLIASILSIYLAGLYMNKQDDKVKEAKDLSKELKKELKKKIKKKKKRILIYTVIFNIGILIILKYCNFIASIVTGIGSLIGMQVTEQVAQIVLPLGISYYTLQAISYVVDVYRGKYKADKNLAKVALFLSFFPQMIEGPIGKFDKLGSQLYEGNKFKYDNIKNGLILITWGVMKKIVIADRAAIFVNNVFGENYNGIIVVVAITLYALQIYAEFSGCMDIVLGIGELFGVKLDQNFKRPFFSRSIQEFWRRWHITLGTWLKDYIFYSVSLSKLNMKLATKVHKIKFLHLGEFITIAFPLFFVWLINGLWHGASFKYVFYGLYYYAIMMIGVLFKPLTQKIFKIFKIRTNVFSYRLFEIIRTTLLVFVGFTIFRAETLSEAKNMLLSIFDFNYSDSIFSFGLSKGDFIVLLFTTLLMLTISIIQEFNINVREKISEQNIVFRWTLYYILIFIVIIFGLYGHGYCSSSFIYGGF